MARAVIRPFFRIPVSYTHLKSLEEAKRFHLAGGQSFIEAQPCGANRMALELRSLSEDSGVHIIASTGFHKLCFYPKEHWIRTLPPSDLEELFVRELTEGMFVDADQGMPQTCLLYTSYIHIPCDRSIHIPGRHA